MNILITTHFFYLKLSCINIYFEFIKTDKPGLSPCWIFWNVECLIWYNILFHSSKKVFFAFQFTDMCVKVRWSTVNAVFCIVDSGKYFTVIPFKYFALYIVNWRMSIYLPCIKMWICSHWWSTSFGFHLQTACIDHFPQPLIKSSKTA